MAPSLPRILDREPQLTRQRGPELCSDRYVLLSAVNKTVVNDGARAAQPPGSKGPSLSPTWIPRGLRNYSPLFLEPCRIIETLSWTIFALLNGFCV